MFEETNYIIIFILNFILFHCFTYFNMRSLFTVFPEIIKFLFVGYLSHTFESYNKILNLSFQESEVYPYIYIYSFLSYLFLPFWRKNLSLLLGEPVGYGPLHFYCTILILYLLYT